MMYVPQRGFTLLIAVVLASVFLTVALALLDVTYKQVVLASTAKHSQVAFYAADSALECVLYYDQTFNAFGANPNGITSISCNGVSVNFSSVGSSPKITQITIPCAGGAPGSVFAYVEIYKSYSTGAENRIYSTGYSSCNVDDSRRIERGIRMLY